MAEIAPGEELLGGSGIGGDNPRAANQAVATRKSHGQAQLAGLRDVYDFHTFRCAG